MRVLILGSGGREHALFLKCSQFHTTYMLGNNGAIDDEYLIKDVDGLDFDLVLKTINDLKIDLTIVGPEVYLQAGIVDFLNAHHKAVFGPTEYCARLEASKNMAKEVMDKVDIPTAKYEYVTDYIKAMDICEEFGYPVVLKYDGLAAGKGVLVAENRSQASEFLAGIFDDRRFGNEGVVIEECLFGEEYSVFVMANKTNYTILPVAQDYKRALDGNLGLNTGGMGANTTSKYDQELDYIKIRIIEPLLKYLDDNSTPYSGFLYIGLMATKDGAKVIEFNVRMGDPETQVVMQKLDSDLVVAITDLLSHQTPNLTIDNQEYVGVVLASNGYPESYPKDIDMNFLKDMTNVYHMGTKNIDGNILSTGGRIAMVTSSGDTVSQAKGHVYQELDKINNPKIHYRKDIALDRI